MEIRNTFTEYLFVTCRNLINIVRSVIRKLKVDYSFILLVALLMSEAKILSSVSWHAGRVSDDTRRRDSWLITKGSAVCRRHFLYHTWVSFFVTYRVHIWACQLGRLTKKKLGLRVWCSYYYLHFRSLCRSMTTSTWELASFWHNMIARRVGTWESENLSPQVKPLIPTARILFVLNNSSLLKCRKYILDFCTHGRLEK